MIRARFRQKVPGRFDGAPSATVEISAGPDPTFSVRPLGRRRVYELPLSVIARGVIYDVVRAELARTPSGRGRRLR
jgi:hypothetical protein